MPVLHRLFIAPQLIVLCTLLAIPAFAAGQSESCEEYLQEGRESYAHGMTDFLNQRWDLSVLHYDASYQASLNASRACQGSIASLAAQEAEVAERSLRVNRGHLAEALEARALHYEQRICPGTATQLYSQAHELWVRIRDAQDGKLSENGQRRIAHTSERTRITAEKAAERAESTHDEERCALPKHTEDTKVVVLFMHLDESRTRTVEAFKAGNWQACLNAVQETQAKYNRALPFINDAHLLRSVYEQISRCHEIAQRCRDHLKQ